MARDRDGRGIEAQKEKHKELKGKSAHQDYVLSLYPHLPQGDDATAQRVAGKRRHQRHSTSSSSEEQEEESSSEGGEQLQYFVDKFIDVAKAGRGYMLRVRWEGFSESNDTWEPMAEMRKTQNTRVDRYICELKEKGEWPPSKQWGNL